MPPQLRASVEQIAWPAVMTGMAAQLFALQRQFDETQFWSPARLRANQFRQLQILIRHAERNVPFYQESLRRSGIDPDAELTDAAWQRLPVLTRHDVQTHSTQLHATDYPSAHGGFAEATSGGSTGVPVRVRKTALESLLWNAAHVRDLLWHDMDPGGTIARVRGMPPHFTPEQQAAVRSPDGLRLDDWGPPYNLLWPTGPMVVIDYAMPIARQAEFLRRLGPDYVLINPSTLRLLVNHCRAERITLPEVRAFWTSNEMLDAELRQLTREVLGKPIIDNYTSGECGYMALQCPACEQYHVQSEVVFLEVLDENDRPCAPGQIGRVVVTPLHNFAMPLLRYAVGDEAEPGSPCACGRGLPVLRRIVGRTIDYLLCPSGEKRRVNFRYSLAAITAIREYQVAQIGLDRIEVRLVTARPLTGAEEARVLEMMAGEFGDEFRIKLAYPASIVRTQAGKLRTFVSELKT
ncbi:MAG: phenylacetate--CoA ligase family protein [Acetobacteraceae bacterium]